jgi:hypothetical protein
VERRASRVKKRAYELDVKKLDVRNLDLDLCSIFFELHFLCFHVVSGLEVRRLIISKGHGSQSPDVPIEP